MTPRKLPSEGGWAGQAAYIIGGGPSLCDFNWESLFPLKNVIAINAAYQRVPYAAAMFTEDARVISRFGHHQDFKVFKGLKILHLLDSGYGPEISPFLEQLTIIRKTRTEKFWSRTWEDGLSVSSNSAVGAFNIASILGAKTIFCLGLDCRKDGDKANFHDAYPRSWAPGKAQLADYASDMENWVALHLKNAGIKVWNVINSRLPSAITVWPQVEFDDFYRMIKGGHPSKVLIHSKEEEIKFTF